ncbi:MAG: hypothetical protein ACYSU3_24770 [Planctomycetota bacterium]
MRCSRTMLILATAIFVFLCLAGHVPAPTGQAAQPEDPYKDSAVRLEVFMVEVRLMELYNLGVPTISQGSESVTAEHILKYLKEQNARALKAAARLEVGQNEQAKTDSIVRQGFYTGISNPVLEYEDFGTSLRAEVQVLSGTKLLVELTFKHTALTKDKPHADKGRPAIIESNWYGRAYLQPGKPTLIGSTQNEHTAAFLIVTANIKK